MSVIHDTIEALLQREIDTEHEPLDIAALFIPHDNTADIESIQIPRDQAEASLSGYFDDEDATFYGLAVSPCSDIQNPSNTLLIAVYLYNNQAGDTYNSRASALLEEDISGNFLLFEFDIETRRFTSNSEALRTTIAIQCDDARQDSWLDTVIRSFTNSVGKTTIGKYFEGFATVTDADEY